MRQSIDPKFIAEGSAERCEAAAHACSGIMCGCDCHDSPAELAERAALKIQLYGIDNVLTTPDAPTED